MNHGANRTLARKRRDVGMTQHQLAQATNIPVNKIVYIETGRTAGTPEEIDSIRKVLRSRAQKVFDSVAGA